MECRNNGLAVHQLQELVIQTPIKAMQVAVKVLRYTWRHEWRLTPHDAYHLLSNCYCDNPVYPKLSKLIHQHQVIWDPSILLYFPTISFIWFHAQFLFSFYLANVSTFLSLSICFYEQLYMCSPRGVVAPPIPVQCCRCMSLKISLARHILRSSRMIHFVAKNSQWRNY